MRLVSTLFASFALIGSSAQADELFGSLRREPIRWGVGLGALVEDEGYVGIGSETEPVPVFMIQRGRFRLFGPQADFRLFGDENTSLGLRADYRFDGYEPGDGAIFEGMAEREGALSLGVSAKHSTGIGEFSFDLVRATSSERGMRGGLYYGYPIELGKLKLLPRIGVEYFDSKFVDYYYGVRREEARSNRPAYEGEATLNLDTGIDLHYSFGEHHTLIAAFKYRAFGSEIKDSPLIEASGSPRANVGYVYRF